MTCITSNKHLVIAFGRRSPLHDHRILDDDDGMPLPRAWVEKAAASVKGNGETCSRYAVLLTLIAARNCLVSPLVLAHDD